MMSFRLDRRAALCALVVAIAAALAMLPAGTASAQEQLPACAPGQFPSPEKPCLLPPCPEGTAPTPERPCVVQGAPLPEGRGFCPPTCPGPPAPNTGPMPGPHGGPCGGPRAVSPGGEPTPGGPKEGPGPCGPPSLMGAFLSRVWRFTAEADNYDAGSDTLSATISKVLNLPKRFGDQDDEIVDQDAHVLIGPQTKVFDAAGKRLARESLYDGALDNADSVLIAGKVLPPAKWQKDEDGQPVTTIRAKRVKITG
jgi:hypothetical protein